jgi:DNA-directed RNA polymerase specialized sigma24 family protein
MSLTTKVQAGTVNRKLVEFYYGLFAKKLFMHTLRYYSISEDDATDLVYKTVYKMAEVHDRYQFKSEKKRNAFVFKTHVNFLRNFFRDNRTFENRNYPADLDRQNLKADQPDSDPKSIALILLEKELDELQEWERILLLMRGQEMSYSSIVPFVDKPEKQLKVYYARLKKQLHKKVNDALQQNKAVDK